MVASCSWWKNCNGDACRIGASAPDPWFDSLADQLFFLKQRSTRLPGYCNQVTQKDRNMFPGWLRWWFHLFSTYLGACYSYTMRNDSFLRVPLMAVEVTTWVSTAISAHSSTSKWRDARFRPWPWKRGAFGSTSNHLVFMIWGGFPSHGGTQ